MSCAGSAAAAPSEMNPHGNIAVAIGAAAQEKNEETARLEVEQNAADGEVTEGLAADSGEDQPEHADEFGDADDDDSPQVGVT